MHVYPGNVEPADSDRLRRSLWFDLVTFADRWGLERPCLIAGRRCIKSPE
jgi:hypothetical protein